MKRSSPMTLNKALRLAIIFFSVGSHAQENIERFARCVSSYESKVLGRDLGQAKVDRELAQVNRLPSISSSIGAQVDSLNKSTYPLGSDWNVSLTQNIYSRSFSRSVAANDENIKATKEQEKVAILQKSLERLDLLFQYVSDLEDLKLVVNQIDRQKKTSQFLQALTKARINDGSSMLSAESDLIVFNSKKRDLELNLKYGEKVLQELPFFDAQKIRNDQEKGNFFSFSGDLIPIETSARSEIIQLDLKAKSDLYFLQSENSQWFPRVDLSIAYSGTSQNSAVGLPVNQLISGLSLTIPISDSLTHHERQGFYQAEISRFETLKERERYTLDTETAFEKKSLVEIKSSITDLNKSLDLLLQSRAILIKKLSLNKVSYFELSNMDDRIDQVSKNVVAKKVQSWRILSKWYLQNFIQKAQPDSFVTCR